jgi:hypothetical protein
MTVCAVRRRKAKTTATARATATTEADLCGMTTKAATALRTVKRQILRSGFGKSSVDF